MPRSMDIDTLLRDVVARVVEDGFVSGYPIVDGNVIQWGPEYWDVDFRFEDDGDAVLQDFGPPPPDCGDSRHRPWVRVTLEEVAGGVRVYIIVGAYLAIPQLDRTAVFPMQARKVMTKEIAKWIGGTSLRDGVRRARARRK